MTPDQFIAKWQHASLKERSAAQEHFIDLCRLLDHPTPAEADPQGDWFAFEFGAKKAGGGDGWADVWKRGCFGWEYKGKGKDLQAAFRQLQLYAPALHYPPLLIVCDLDAIIIHAAFTNAVQEIHVIPLAELADPAQRQKLHWAFTEPERLRPGRTRTEVTAEAAAKLALLAESLRGRGHHPQAVAHFLTQCLFCLFAEDVGLLPAKLFERIVEKSRSANIGQRLAELFSAMRGGGEFLLEDIAWFNGGLFEQVEPLPLEDADLRLLLAAARLDWTAIEPAIFGTLFERGLDPAKRSQLGAHYTDPATILRLIRPTLSEPLQAEWQGVKAVIERDKSKTRKQATAALQGFLERLRNFRVLDPACGSGNFLYLALHSLKDIEHQVNLEAEALGLHRSFPAVGPENMRGIELNPYAAELARVTLWIGEIQWMLNHGYRLNDRPILRPLESIEQRDALINTDGTEAQWPAADVIVGNPPFLGGFKMISELGEEYTAQLRACYKDRVPGTSDLVAFWFEKARAQIEGGQCKNVGLVATNSIRQPANRLVMERIASGPGIFAAWSDEPWINEGAAVRVSLVAFGEGGERLLNGQPVTTIHSDLRSGDDLTTAERLEENGGVSFFGLALAGKFTIDYPTAQEWMPSPNPNGRSNGEVLRPLWNGQDLTGRWMDRWVIDFGPRMEAEDAMLYEKPFEHVVTHVKPVRATNREKIRAEKWWRHGRPRPEMRNAIQGLGRYIVTSEKSKHRFFVWLDEALAPDNRLVVIARNDDTTFGILSSRIHVCWALAVGSTLEDRPAYATKTCFETFPFPEGLTPNLRPEDYSNPQSTAIAQAAARLNQLRENWLNPPEWVDWVITPAEEQAGFPARAVAKPGHEADLKKRTLTNLYNQRPAWLDRAHRQLDEAVAAAYGWPVDISDEEVLRRLLALNRERSEH